MVRVDCSHQISTYRRKPQCSRDDVSQLYDVEVLRKLVLGLEGSATRLWEAFSSVTEYRKP